jgi:hypothetical protein
MRRGAKISNKASRRPSPKVISVAAPYNRRADALPVFGKKCCFLFVARSREIPQTSEYEITSKLISSSDLNIVIVLQFFSASFFAKQFPILFLKRGILHIIFSAN